MTLPHTVTVPVLLETPVARSLCHVSESRWPSYWRASATLRNATKVVGKRRVFLASAVAKHVVEGMNV